MKGQVSKNSEPTALESNICRTGIGNLSQSMGIFNTKIPSASKSPFDLPERTSLRNDAESNISRADINVSSPTDPNRTPKIPLSSELLMGLQSIDPQQLSDTLLFDALSAPSAGLFTNVQNDRSREDRHFLHPNSLGQHGFGRDSGEVDANDNKRRKMSTDELRFVQPSSLSLGTSLSNSTGQTSLPNGMPPAWSDLRLNSLRPSNATLLHGHSTISSANGASNSLPNSLAPSMLQGLVASSTAQGLASSQASNFSMYGSNRMRSNSAVEFQHHQQHQQGNGTTSTSAHGLLSTHNLAPFLSNGYSTTTHSTGDDNSRYTPPSLLPLALQQRAGQDLSLNGAGAMGGLGNGLGNGMGNGLGNGMGATSAANSNGSEHLLIPLPEPNREGKYPCPYPGCNLSYSQTGNLKRHIISVHQGVRYVCPEPNCGVYYKDASTLRQHSFAVHKGVRYPCVHCGKTFNVRSNLTRHLKSKHPEFAATTIVKGVYPDLQQPQPSVSDSNFFASALRGTLDPATPQRSSQLTPKLLSQLLQQQHQQDDFQLPPMAKIDHGNGHLSGQTMLNNLNTIHQNNNYSNQASYGTGFQGNINDGNALRSNSLARGLLGSQSGNGNGPNNGTGGLVGNDMNDSLDTASFNALQSLLAGLAKTTGDSNPTSTVGLSTTSLNPNPNQAPMHSSLAWTNNGQQGHTGLQLDSLTGSGLLGALNASPAPSNIGSNLSSNDNSFSSLLSSIPLPAYHQSYSSGSNMNHSGNGSYSLNNQMQQSQSLWNTATQSQQNSNQPPNADLSSESIQRALRSLVSTTETAHSTSHSTTANAGTTNNNSSKPSPNLSELLFPTAFHAPSTTSGHAAGLTSNEMSSLFGPTSNGASGFSANGFGGHTSTSGSGLYVPAYGQSLSQRPEQSSLQNLGLGGLLPSSIASDQNPGQSPSETGLANPLGMPHRFPQDAGIKRLRDESRAFE